MPDSPAWLGTVGEVLGPVAPKAAMVIGTLVGGLFVSWLAKRAAGYLVRRSGLESLAEKLGAAKLLYSVGAKDGVTPLVQKLVWYAGVLITVSTLADLLGLGSVKDGIGSIMAFLPKLLAGGAVLAAGFWLAGFLRGLIQRVTQKEDEPGQGSPLAQVAYFAVVTVSSTVALDQAGIEISLLSSILELVVAAAVFAIALAFALGGREAFSNLVARHYYSALVRPGDRLRFGEVEGTVARVTAVAVIVTTDESEHVIPCSALLGGVAEIKRGAGED